ncbi:Protein Y48G1C.6 [Aphelenchoides avenae]|nr:Protein Y48G1C.6 [Aphelenchus avenae]
MSGSEPEAPAPAEAALAADTSKRKKFDNVFKLEVLEYAKRHKTKDGKPNKDGAAKHFGIHRKNVQRWFDQEDELKKNKKGKRLPGGDRRLKLKQFDQDVSVWLKQAREKKLPVTVKAVKITLFIA